MHPIRLAEDPPKIVGLCRRCHKALLQLGSLIVELHDRRNEFVEDIMIAKSYSLKKSVKTDVGISCFWCGSIVISPPPQKIRRAYGRTFNKIAPFVPGGNSAREKSSLMSCLGVAMP